MHSFDIVIVVCHCYCYTISIARVVHWILTESLVAEIQKKIEEAFEVFDHDRGKTVDVRYSILLLH